MKKRFFSLLSVMLLLATVWCALPTAVPLRAQALSNASALTPYPYKTGSYTALRKLTAYTAAGGSKSAGFTVSKGASVKVTAVSGQYGKVTSGKKSGWIDLGYAAGKQNQTDIPARLAMLRRKFPDGMYWNRVTAGVNNPDGYSDQPCQSGHTDKRDNSFDGTGQCHGFALKLGYDLFGIHADDWERHYDLDRVVPGDFIRYRGRHTVMVTGVYGDGEYFSLADCNYDCGCGIAWDRMEEKSFFSFYTNNRYDGIYHCPTNTGGLRTFSFTTALSTSDACTAYLMMSDECGYPADGVTKNGKTTFTFRAPAGTYQEFMIESDEGESYHQDNFVLGTSKLPASVTLRYYADIDSDSYVSDDIRFTVQPANVTAYEGSSAKLSAKAETEGASWWYGSSELYYRWYYRKPGERLWTRWTGREAASFTFTATSSWNNVQVRCEAYTWYGDYAYSRPVRVTVTKPVSITQQPVSASGAVNDTVTFKLQATGAKLSYQWYYKKAGDSAWTKWNKMTSASVSTPVYASWNKAQFYCLVKDGSGKTAKSNAVTLTVAPKITAQPKSVAVKVNAKAAFTVQATGAGLSYQWYYKKVGDDAWTLWKNQTAPSASLTVYKSWNGAKFYCVVKDGSGKSTKSSTAVLTVK